jgi:polyisoprenoid-binding protein YceI
MRLYYHFRWQLWLVAIGCAALAASALASSQLGFRVDPAGSNVNAKVAFFGLASKTASFNDISGSVQLQPANLQSLTLNVVIDARTLTASDSVTQMRLKGDKFFHVAQHPTVRFVGSGLTMTSATAGSVNGNLTARGVTRPVTLTVIFSEPPAKIAARQGFTITGTTTIDRRDFGMTAYSAIVGRKVKITLKAKLVAG